MNLYTLHWLYSPLVAPFRRRVVSTIAATHTPAAQRNPGSAILNNRKMSVFFGACRRVPMKMGARYLDAGAAVSSMMNMRHAGSWPLPTAPAAAPYSTTAARRVGKKKEIGAGLKDEEIRPGDRSLVRFCGRKRAARGVGGTCIYSVDKFTYMD